MEERPNNDMLILCKSLFTNSVVVPSHNSAAWERVIMSDKHDSVISVQGNSVLTKMSPRQITPCFNLPLDQIFLFINYRQGWKHKKKLFKYMLAFLLITSFASGWVLMSSCSAGSHEAGQHCRPGSLPRPVPPCRRQFCHLGFSFILILARRGGTSALYL